MDPALRELIDKQHITEALYRYCRGIDRGDRGLASSVWHPDGLADYGPGLFTGTGAGFVDWVWGPHGGVEYDMFQHRLTNILIEVRGDRAVSETYFAGHLQSRDEHGNPRLSNHYGRFEDEWSRRGDAWGIDKRLQIFDFFTSDAPEATLPGYPGTRDQTDRSHSVLRSLGR